MPMLSLVRSLAAASLVAANAVAAPLEPQPGASATPASQGAPPAAPAALTPAATREESGRSVEKVVEDYVGLYAGPTLDRWKKLFHPALIVAYPGEEGTARTRGLDGFFKAQKDYFATGRRISERLENVRIDQGRRIARVVADFVFSDEGRERRGKLGLHLVDTFDGWRITAIVFSYDDEG